jgi:hypothetical protein
MNNTRSSLKPKAEFASATAKLTTVIPCPACSHTKGWEVKMARVYECGACHAIHGTMYLGDSYTYVLPCWSNDHSPEATERQRYFDFECLGSGGVTRRHGWFDPQTKKITQIG